MVKKNKKENKSVSESENYFPNQAFPHVPRSFHLLYPYFETKLFVLDSFSVFFKYICYIINFPSQKLLLFSFFLR